MRGVVSSDVTAAVTAGGGALELLAPAVLRPGVAGAGEAAISYSSHWSNWASNMQEVIFNMKCSGKCFSTGVVSANVNKL